MPTRPSQNDPQRVAEWERLRQMVGQNIRDARTEQGMSQETLALLSGVTRNVLIDVEHGRRGLLYERIYDLASALQVPIDRLLAGEQGRG
ncbi:helix-turn-helix transcriptional regulator [Mycobacterium sp. NPDC006124]|uniref:helix-turn-helix domain-containing protein n=1 Tax=Mycobacterium sp. NPDC006124 TaxID=3156729 RepID=UPI0033A7FE38